MTTCQDIENELSDALDGELPWHRAFVVRVHLWLCPPCKRKMESLERTVTALRGCKHGRCASSPPTDAPPPTGGAV